MMAYVSNVKLILLVMAVYFILMHVLDGRPNQVMSSVQGFYQQFGSTLKQQLIKSYEVMTPSLQEWLLILLALLFAFQMYRRLIPAVYFMLFILALYLVAFLGVPGRQDRVL
jgi:hypothetical protein